MLFWHTFFFFGCVKYYFLLANADLKFEEDVMARSSGTDDLESWRDDLQWRLKQESDFLAQLRARRQRSGNSSQTTSDNEQEGWV